MSTIYMYIYTSEAWIGEKKNVDDEERREYTRTYIYIYTCFIFGLFFLVSKSSVYTNGYFLVVRGKKSMSVVFLLVRV